MWFVAFVMLRMDGVSPGVIRRNDTGKTSFCQCASPPGGDKQSRLPTWHGAGGEGEGCVSAYFPSVFRMESATWPPSNL